MRQIILFFLCTIANLVMAQEKIEYRYWFDNSNETIYTGLADKNDFHLDIDASNLKTGLHSFNYQILDGGKGESSVMSSLFYKLSSFLNKKSIVSIDGKVSKDYSAFTDNPSLIRIDVDAQSLDLGVHTLSVQVVDDSGVGSSNIEAFFTRVPTQGDIQSMSLYYMIDYNIGKKQPCTFTNSLASAEIDASSLSDGLHSITFFMYNPNGLATQAKSTFFIKEPLGGNGIKAYKYWLNEDVEHCQEKEFDPTKAEVKIVGLFDMEHPELRSSNFHFAIEDDKAVLYPKNTFNLRVNDVSGRITSSKSDYIDVTKRELLDMNSIVPIASGQSYDNSVSDKNGISWYQFTGKDGDSISVRANRACMLEVFSPSGKILHQTDGYDATTANGIFLEEDGTYYVALHDVRTSAKDVNLDFYQIAKYAVVSYDTHTVGNGGCSTISFTGNGFKNLYAIDIVGNGNCIRHINIGHESNTRTSASFDFANAKVGIYDIVFHFVDEDKIIKGILKIEKAVPLSITSEVAFSPSYLRGKSTTYTITVTNTGNMTAYMLPIYTFIEGNGVERVYFHNMELPNTLNNICTESLSKDEIAYIDSYLHSKGDLWHFLHGKANVKTSEQKETYSNYFFATIPPKTSVTYKLEIYSSEPVAAYITVPDEWHSVLFDTDTSKRNSSKALMKSDKSYCCISDNIECFVNGVAVTLDIASLGTYLLTIGFPESGIAEAAAAIASAGSCAASSLNASLGPINTVICNAIGNEADVLAGIKNSIKAASISGAILSCLSHCTSLFKDVIKLSKAEDIAQGGIFNTLISFFDIAGGGYSCSSYTTAKPGCPPIPPGGGTSTPVAPVDPNDILGYVTQSGSHYVGLNQKKLGYTIEFENDATKATASAHEIVIKDKLDVNIFDSNSIHTSKVVIGKHEIDIDADGEFVKTIDMRPAINALAEVKLNISQNGEVVYSITSLDPMTAESTSDMMAGILPINNADKDGEGYIVFDVKLKDGLADGTKIDNAASIIFDANDAISTPVWSNETDYIRPVGYVDGIKQVDSNHIKIEIDGIDERSGIWKYDLYYQAGAGSSWFPLAEDLTSNSYEMEVYDDIDYGFCVVATDMAGNKEVKNLSRDYSYLNGVITSGIEKVDMNNSNLKGRVYDLSGRRVKGKPSKGIYIAKGKKILFQ